jgi:hypothetical protein
LAREAMGDARQGLALHRRGRHVLVGPLEGHAHDVTVQPNATITFTLAGQTCVGTTDPAGEAQCMITPNEPAGTYSVSASFAGGGQHLASTASATFTVTLEETSLTSTKSLQVLAAGSPVTFSATLTDPDGGAPVGGNR